MTDESFRVAELIFEGTTCSHVLAKLALEAQRQSSPELMRAMAGLNQGLGHAYVCGALTGGCCVIGLYAGRGSDDRSEHPDFAEMLDDYVKWFEATTAEYGGHDCLNIIHGDKHVQERRCPGLIVDAWMKIKEILEKHHIEVDAPPPVDWELA
ncbi:MAG: C-GCAxxG-C-C family protein [Ancalomicrobiaceae bacterium]|nr:C-GCAxxG-C-C family protein [Ancalomicrobiaceae bacterium]